MRIATLDATGLYYNSPDHLTSASVITDVAGLMVQKLDYMPFGSERVNEKVGGFQTRFTFTDQEKDAESGLMYYGARYYDPVIGRFTSVDPVVIHTPGAYLLDPQQSNAHSYARNNPLRFVDVTGETVGEYQPYEASGEPNNYGQLLGEYRETQVRSAGLQKGQGVHPYQCTTLVKDFSQNQNDVNLKGTGNGDAYGNQANINWALKQNNPNRGPGAYVVYENSGQSMPQENDIISWSGGQYGHVGIIVEVTFDKESGTGYVYTMEQNVSTNTGLFSQPLARSYDEQGQAMYTVGNRLQSLQVQGWARYQNQSTLPNANQNYTSIPYTPAPKSVIRESKS